MKMEQLMEHLIAAIMWLKAMIHKNQTETQANQAKTDPNLREIRAGQEHLKEEMKAKMDSHHEKLMTLVKADKEKIEAIREACLEKTESCLESKEPVRLELESIAVHEDIPKEEAIVKTVGALKKWHRDRHPAIRCHGQPKKRTQGNCGSRKKLAAACTWMTGRAILAWHKGPGHQRQG
jgi:hypothetical protein